MSEPIYQPSPRKPGETFEGKPCRTCRATTRYTSNKHCVACMKISNNSLSQKLYQKSPKGKTIHRKSQRQYQKHSIKYKQYMEIYRKLPKYYDGIRAYQQTPKGKAVKRAADSKIHAKRRSAEGSYTGIEWTLCLEKFNYCCLRCSKNQSMLDRSLEPDHVIPLSKGGSNWITNIQPLCHDCNGMSGKGTKIIDYRPMRSF